MQQDAEELYIYVINELKTLIKMSDGEYWEKTAKVKHIWEVIGNFEFNKSTLVKSKEFMLVFMHEIEDKQSTVAGYIDEVLELGESSESDKVFFVGDKSGAKACSRVLMKAIKLYE